MSTNVSACNTPPLRMNLPYRTSSVPVPLTPPTVTVPLSNSNTLSQFGPPPPTITWVARTVPPATTTELLEPTPPAKSRRFFQTPLSTTRTLLLLEFSPTVQSRLNIMPPLLITKLFRLAAGVAPMKRSVLLLHTEPLSVTSTELLTPLSPITPKVLITFPPLLTTTLLPLPLVPIFRLPALDPLIQVDPAPVTTTLLLLLMT